MVRHYTKDACWTHVKRTPTGKRHDQINCNYCDSLWCSSDARRVQKHLSKCTSAPLDVKQQFEALVAAQAQANQNIVYVHAPGPLPENLPVGSSSNQYTRQPPALPQLQHAGPVAYQTTTLDRPSNTTQTELQAACARWIHKSGLPLTTTEHPAFKALMHNLNPGFTPPTREQLAKNHALQRAIDAASQPILATALREICDRNEAAKEIAREMLMPPHTHPAAGGATEIATRGTRRRASSVEVIDRVCQHCDREFSDRAHLGRDCMYHPGKSSIQPHLSLPSN
jgi:hypothetical protein